MTIRRTFLLMTLALAMAANVHAQDLESYKKKHDDALLVILVEHSNHVVNIKKAYTTGLNTLKERLQTAGDLNKLKAVLAEISRFEKDQTFPTGQTRPIPGVMVLADDCQANVAEAEKAKAQKIVTLASQYDKALLRLQRGRTRKGELDKATAIQKERKILAETRTLIAAIILLARTHPTHGSSVDAKKGPPALSKPPTYPADAQEYKGHHYKVFSEVVSWHEAKEKCERMGGYIVCIANEAENSFVSKLGNGIPLWLGGTDSRQEGKWEWVTGEQFTYSNWAGQNPDGDGDYLSFSWKIDRGRGWNDRPARARRSEAAGFVCEWNE